MNITIYHNSGTLKLDSDDELNQFAKDYTLIEAGGGIVVDKNGSILMIYRNGYWDLPKGKLDDGETIEECAEREIKEETGLSEITLTKPLTTTFHTYILKEQPILKKTSWFLFHCNTEQDLTPQFEEGITAIEWVAFSAISPYLSKSFESIKHVLEAYHKISAAN